MSDEFPLERFERLREIKLQEKELEKERKQLSGELTEELKASTAYSISPWQEVKATLVAQERETVNLERLEALDPEMYERITSPTRVLDEDAFAKTLDNGEWTDELLDACVFIKVSTPYWLFSVVKKETPDDEQH